MTPITSRIIQNILNIIKSLILLFSWGSYHNVTIAYRSNYYNGVVKSCQIQFTNLRILQIGLHNPSIGLIIFEINNYDPKASSNMYSNYKHQAKKCQSLKAHTQFQNFIQVFTNGISFLYNFQNSGKFGHFDYSVELWQSCYFRK